MYSQVGGGRVLIVIIIIIFLYLRIIIITLLSTKLQLNFYIKASTAVQVAA